MILIAHNVDILVSLGSEFQQPVVFQCRGKTSNIRRTLVLSKIVDRSDVVGAPPVGAAPTTSSFSI